LGSAQPAIETALARRHLKDGTLVRARSAGCASRPAARGALMMDTPLLINGLLERALSERRTEKLISYAFDLFFLDG
jgi:hypothetical protein